MVENTDNSERFHVYKARWYVLVMICLMMFLHSCLFNLWGPIARTLNIAFGWGKTEVILLTFCSEVVMMFGPGFATFIRKKNGVRYTVIVCNVLLFLSCLMRSFVYVPHYIALAVFSAFFAGIPASPCDIMCVFVSEQWFPVHQRSCSMQSLEQDFIIEEFANSIFPWDALCSWSMDL